MKLTSTMLVDIGLKDLIQGTPLEVPYFLKKDIDLLYQDSKQIIAFMHHRYLNDHRIYSKVMILLNQLIRFYKCEVILHIFSYRTLICQEKIYLTFKKTPIHKEN